MPDAPVYAYARAFDAESFHEAVRKLATTRWVASEDGPSLIVLEDHFAVLYFYPNDERLHGLRRLMVGKKLQRLLYTHLPEYPATNWRVSDRSIRHQLLRYKPERRAVIRSRFRAHRHSDGHREERFLYISVFEQGRDAEVWRTATRLHGMASSPEWTVPKPLAHIAEHAAVLVDSLEGDSLKMLMEGSKTSSEIEPAVRRAARALAGIHALRPDWLPIISPGSRLSMIKDVVDRIGWLAPEFAPQARECHIRLSSRIQRCFPAEATFVHGDLHPGQIIINDEQCGFVDFDRAHVGDPAMDLGMFIAQLEWNADSDERTSTTRTVGQWLGEYRRASARRLVESHLDTWISYALLQSALRPLGRFETGWRARIRKTLDGVLTCLK
jgi:aminoglycoside phosphotransferase (APT) family kinase protein